MTTPAQRHRSVPGLGSWPARRARITPDRVALVGAERDLTYAEPADRAARLGVNAVEVFETFFATWLLGAVAVPLNGRLAGGENVYPAEVEAVLVRLDSVLDAAVVGVPDPRWGEVGVACVQPRDGAAPTEDELRAHLAAHLARYKIPRHLVLVDELPRGATGKVRRVELRQRAADPLPPAAREEPRVPLSSP